MDREEAYRSRKSSSPSYVAQRTRNSWVAYSERKNLQVMVSVDDGGWRAFAPLSVDFIRGPDGSFVGE